MGKRILYFECKTGAAGDMLMGALYSLLSPEDKSKFLDKLNSIHEEIIVTPMDKTVKGIGGIHMRVSIRGKEEEEHPHHHHHPEQQEAHHHPEQQGAHSHHHHTSYTEMLEIIGNLDVDEKTKADAAAIYQLIGEAESQVHRTNIKQIHFHEIGSLDAMIDVVGCCLAIQLLGVDEIQASPVCVGNGTVRCAHGVLPVPAPATAEIIKGMPVYFSSYDGELLTPTGGAVLKHFVQTYTRKLHMTIESIGYGLGTKEFENPSFVRAFLGEEYH